ncbi:MAG: PHB depolymerase family esterase [Burkholderiaceae bacterium]
MNETLQDLMRSATRLTQAGRLNEATAAIQRALRGAAPAATPARPESSAEVLDGCVFEVETPAPAATKSAHATFINGTHTHAGLTRGYKLFVPPARAGKPRALLVMLHGCTQDPDDFAAGTGMNDAALEEGFVVLYPAQAQDANPSRCWNWFKHTHQQRGRGEPAVIADMARAVMKEHSIDPRRVYIAGLSAGGAMAIIVAEAYPELFAAVGVHSGLPRGAASSVPEALSVMGTGVAGNAPQPRAGRIDDAAPVRVPTIVFHGDQDRTVHPRNGEQVLAAALGGTVAGAARVEQGTAGQGRRYTRSSHAADDGTTQAEHWLLHGAGHAWSGGRAAGSYTDAAGPDATREMLRFFFEHPLRP